MIDAYNSIGNHTMLAQVNTSQEFINTQITTV